MRRVGVARFAAAEKVKHFFLAMEHEDDEVVRLSSTHPNLAPGVVPSTDKTEILT